MDADQFLTPFEWGDVVHIALNAPQKYRPGEMGSVCGIRTNSLPYESAQISDNTKLYLVEFSDGDSIEISECFCERFKPLDNSGLV